MPKVAESKTVVDVATGEVVSQTVVEKEVNAEPDYLKLYIDGWVAFKDIKGVNTSFMVQLLPFMAYAENGQLIFVNATLKRVIAQRLGWSERTALKRFNEEARKLVRAGVLKHVGTGAFAVNPELVGRGSWRDIKRLRATFNVIGPGAGTVDVELG